MTFLPQQGKITSKEIRIVHRLFLVRISYCVRTCRVKQKQKQTKVFTNLLRGFVDSSSGSCVNSMRLEKTYALFEFP